ncbi:hypothetical protein QE250_00120 [Chromatiaceae bacterium AAb-1]|nr:hypothetical protein [Chromatiaceae bacterium AAb-1]
MKKILLATALILSVTPVAAEPAKAAQQFWDNLAQHCGKAYAGKRVIARDDRPDMLNGDETLIVHFRTCSEQLLTLPFHIGKTDGSWDRSRTWRFSWADEQLELRHDHRLENGEPDHSNTMYGGLSIPPGTEQLQSFLFTERVSDAGEPLGWKIEIVPGERYSYGTYMGERWSWRVDFDLTTPLPQVPVAPWGF